jgi:PPK2 family polyphosphate:nucleotide phosphotransferase
MSKQPLSPKPGTRVDLKDFDPDYHDDDMTKTKASAEIADLHVQMETLQEMLYAQSKYALLIVLQAMDTGGKDGTIKKVFEPINPQGVRVTSFKAPTSEELAHDFLWRVHPHVPPKGYIGIFNRSHYEEVLIVRVNSLAPKEVWEQHYDQINAFERLLTENGTHILKFYLHISKDEQKRRFQERLDDPKKQWKFAIGDLDVRKRWDDYLQAYEAVLTKCNTDYARWYIVPANRKWYRDLVIARVIVETLQSMNLSYPPPEPGLETVVIPD